MLGHDELSGAGLRVVDAEHFGNSSASPEEAEVVATLIRRVLGRAWSDAQGQEQWIDSKGILVVTSFNAQIREIEEVLRRKRESGIRVRITACELAVTPTRRPRRTRSTICRAPR